MTCNRRALRPTDATGAGVARTGTTALHWTMPGAAALALAAVPRDSPADHGRA